MKKLLILTVFILLAGCSAPVSEELIPSEEIEITSTVKDLTLGRTLQLTAQILPATAKQEFLYSSDNEQVASVDGNGLVSGVGVGNTIISVYAKDNVMLFDQIRISVYDDEQDEALLAAAISQVSSLIPAIVEADLDLPSSLDGVNITYQSSNTYLLRHNGQIIPAATDQSVGLEVTFTKGRQTESRNYEMTIKKYTLKEISNRKVFFTYLYDPAQSQNFQGFRAGDLDRIDVINYSFGGIRDGKVSIAGFGHFEEVMKAHEKGVRVVLAIGGWGVGGFSEAVASAQTRTVFIQSIMEVIQNYHFDGIDIDWEYPTSTAGGLISASVDDRVNFSVFMKELRLAMDQLDENLILSCAVAAGTYAASNYYEVSELNKYIDYLHIMTYDMINYSTYQTTHHSNLFASIHSTFSVAQAVEAYSSRGMAKDKIVIGAAYYGHLFVPTGSDQNGIGQASNRDLKGTISYKRIVEEYLNNPLYTVFTDQTAQAKWIYGNDIFISYDDETSVQAKANYVLDQGLAGVMVWEYCKDDAASSLTKAIYNQLSGNN